MIERDIGAKNVEGIFPEQKGGKKEEREREREMVMTPPLKIMPLHACPSPARHGIGCRVWSVDTLFPRLDRNAIHSTGDRSRWRGKEDMA